MAEPTNEGDLVRSVLDAFMSQQESTWDLLTRELDSSVQEHKTEFSATSESMARPRVCTEGELIEKAACNFTHSRGASLPAAASERNPHLAGKPFAALALSVIVHPSLPRIPTTHMNVRFFHIAHGNGHWYFGGGMDLTPHFLYNDDAVTWHEHARDACRDHAQYQQFKRQCDDYFYLPHRNEARGIGGLFFDDLNEPDFASCFELVIHVCEQFRAAYRMIFNRRKSMPTTAEDECWMLHRRSRYAEFNLIHDRGTRYGLQSGRRVESVLASLPPRANWTYGRNAQTEEQRELVTCLQNAQDWL